MALIVEDGTGLADADSFTSVAEFKTYCENRGIDITSAQDTDIEKALREATEYVCICALYRGAKSKGTQALEFPRADCIDRTGLLIEGVPRRVKDATNYLASEVMAGTPLLEAQERGGKIASESVAGISTSYAADAPAGTTFPKAMQLLEPFIRNQGSFTPNLGFTAPETASFPTNHYSE